jgi:hypothetical protein
MSIDKRDCNPMFLKAILESNLFLYLHVNSNLEIVSCNNVLRELLDLTASPTGNNVTSFLNDKAASDLHESIEKLQNTESSSDSPSWAGLTLRLSSVNVPLVLVDVLIVEYNDGFQLIGKKERLKDNEVAESMSELNNELINMTRQLQKKNEQLTRARNEVKTLHGLLPICAYCKNIRDDEGYWHKVETYIHNNSDTDFTHSICPDCVKKLYPDLDLHQDK